MGPSPQQVEEARKLCQDIQHMIDLTGEHLGRLRGAGTPGDALTRQEVRALESKLVRQVSEQLAAKARLGGQGHLLAFPRLLQWLQVVGVSAEAREAIMARLGSLEELLAMPQGDLQRILLTSGPLNLDLRREELRRLTLALASLRRCREALVGGAHQDTSTMDLHWDSWNLNDSVTAAQSFAPTAPQQERVPPQALPLPLRRKGIGGFGLPSSFSFSTSPSSTSTSTLSSTTSDSRSPMITPPATPPWASLAAKPPSQSKGTPPPAPEPIAHRFTKTFKPARCDLCQIFYLQGLRCKECRVRCHTQCEALVPPSCGLPPDLLEIYWKHLRARGGSPSPSSSSCNSSTPTSPQVTSSSSSRPHFTFPDPVPPSLPPALPPALPHVPLEREVPNPAVESVRSDDSDKTLSGSLGTGSSMEDQDLTTLEEGDRQSTWSLSTTSTTTTTMSIREWDIPYEELSIGDRIGSGRFSSVHAGQWHGDVAIKLIRMDDLEDEHTLEAFRLDVATFRKTRHENLVLFMGASVAPPHLALVTALCKGYTLHAHLHLRRDRWDLAKVATIATQVAQGMGYLHHKAILHKDLRTKNIFLENGRAIITDFGLVNVARRYRRPGGRAGGGVAVPAGWLGSLAPELVREVRVQGEEGEEEELPFTPATDVFAFGSIWYELVTGEWPWRGHHPEAVIWQVGRGMRPSLSLASTLDNLPRGAKATASSSHMARSAEALF